MIALTPCGSPLTGPSMVRPRVPFPARNELKLLAGSSPPTGLPADPLLPRLLLLGHLDMARNLILLSRVVLLLARNLLLRLVRVHMHQRRLNLAFPTNRYKPTYFPSPAPRLPFTDNLACSTSIPSSSSIICGVVASRPGSTQSYPTTTAIWRKARKYDALIHFRSCLHRLCHYHCHIRDPRYCYNRGISENF